MDELSKSIMEGNLLLASAAVFRSFYDENLDQQDILAKFVTASVHLNKLKVFDSSQLANAMKKDYGFEIPEAVIRNCIRKKLKKDFESTGNARNQFQTSDSFSPPIELDDQFKVAQRAQDQLTLKLVEYVESETNCQLQPTERDLLVRDFYDHVKGQSRAGINAAHIGLFIIGLSDKSDLDVIEQAKQGLVIFEGLRYSVDSSGATLPSDLTFYLDTEILFSAAGLHGNIRRDLFLDFHKLATELNQKAKRNNGKILFRYFDDTAVEIEKYFGSARSIVEGKERLNPTRDAMVSIVNGCDKKSHVIDKEISFWATIDKLGIRKDDQRGYLVEHAFNIESTESCAQVSREVGCNEDVASSILSKFSRINFFRKGVSDPPMEAVNAIFMSGKNVVRQAGFLAGLYPGKDRFVPYSIDLDFTTTWLWSKLGKAFGPNQSTPTAFSIVSRTRVVLSAQLGAKISEEYDRLKLEIEDKATGESRREDIARALSKLKTIKISPEDVGEAKADLAFLFEDDLIGRAAEEHLALVDKVERGEQAEINREKAEKKNMELELELKKLKEKIERDDADSLRRLRLDNRNERRAQSAPLLSSIRIKQNIIKFTYWTAPSAAIAYILFRLISPADTPIGIIGVLLTATIPTTIALYNRRKSLERFCSSYKWNSFRTIRRTSQQAQLSNGGLGEN